MGMIIYSADHEVGDPTNVLYPNQHVVDDATSLAEAVAHDYVGVEFRDNRRKTENYIKSNCIIMDCDNDHSDDPSEWVNPDDVAEAFPGVTFGVHYSKHHNLQKGNKPARPRGHYIFPCAEITDAVEYSVTKRRVYQHFPYFDANALDSARFFAGTTDPHVEWHDGTMTVTEFLNGLNAEPTFADPSGPVPASGASGSPYSASLTVIPQGERNVTLSRFAGRVLTRLGDTPEAREAFNVKVALCDPPLPSTEVETIWQSALNFLAKVQSQPGYVPPNNYNTTVASPVSYRPADATDVGQARVLADRYGDVLCYTKEMGYVAYRDGRWDADETQARTYAQDLTMRQMQESADIIKSESANGKPDHAVLESAKNYLAYAMRRRSSSAISACLTEAKPMLAVSLDRFDADPYLLNTPSGTIDLRNGLAGLREHHSNDYLTQMTAVSPGDDGMDHWLAFLDTTFCGDADLIRYVQLQMGQMLVGKVFQECLIIAYGSGRNGKSTLFNAIARVMGTYSGKVSATILTAGAKHSNVLQEMASVRGKRLVIASEMTEGARLDDGTLKQLCATDALQARYLYKEPFSFIPSHTLVLYTNHLPRVSSLDDGTWRRLVVVPFNARIEGDSDIKNYAEFLVDHAGGAILTWLVEGAKDAIDAEYRIDKPLAVTGAIEAYRDSNDWLANFLLDACITGNSDDCIISTLELYRTYRNHCIDNEEYIRKPADFYVAVEGAGFKRKTVKRRQYFVGLRLRTDADDNDDGQNDVSAARDDSTAQTNAAIPPTRDDDFPDFLM